MPSLIGRTGEQICANCAYIAGRSAQKSGVQFVDFNLFRLIMASPSLSVIEALRTTAQRLSTQAPYQWGHMGSCNCGHLAQTITRLSKADIHARALERYGDWNQQLHDYCPSSGLPIDEVIDEMLAAGFTRADLAHLERLSAPDIRAAIPAERRQALRHNYRDDVVLYLRTWARLLEDQLITNLPLPLPLPAGAVAVS